MAGGSENGLIGHHEESSFSYKRATTTVFNMDTGICHKCIRTQNCSKVKNGYCKKWGDEQETCTDIQM
ncbi:MAG: hypothetical protein MJ158_00715 [Alphaproteobacteria bacterium]|nr:hypothetical protein [Alphaproteobacteria bacterium]